MTLKLIGPITQLLTMDSLPVAGPIKDSDLHIIRDAGILIKEGKIVSIDWFDSLFQKGIEVDELDQPTVALPGFIDAHTHLCFAGSRAADYALRSSGMSYKQIAEQGGGILETVRQTRQASLDHLVDLMIPRLNRQLQQGITTCEIKSGYGLSVPEEIKLLKAIHLAASKTPVHIIPTCLAAHTIPSEYASGIEYLQTIVAELFPAIKTSKLCDRVDIFIDSTAFASEEARYYLQSARKAGFSCCVHANQFSSGGAEIAAEMHAVSADHLEHLSPLECDKLREANVVAVALPGASLGLGVPMPPSRFMLDSGLILAIASDWNPGSAPMGHLLTEASLLGALEKLTLAETMAAITCRAAKALNLPQKGQLKKGFCADIALFPSDNYQEVLYYQGSLLPYQVYINGILEYKKYK